MQKRYLAAGIFLLLALVSPALAQDEAAPAEEATAEQAVTEEAAPAESVDQAIEEAGLSAEAIEDETVTEEDLDAKTPGAFSFFKKITRTVQRVVTRDPIKKAELRIEEAHEELLRAQKIAEENPDDEKSQEKVEKALNKFESNIEKVKEHAADIKEKKADQAGDFLQKIADFQIKQQKVLDKLEEKLPAGVFEKVEQARQRTIQNQSDVMTRVAQNAEQITERFNAALQNQRGSDFREFKNIEVLERVAEFVPEEARAAIEQAQAAARGRFEEHIQALPEDMRNEAFGRYMKNIIGDPIHQMRALDNIKSQANLPDDFFGQIEAAKEATVSKFEERFRRFEDPAGREQFLATLADGSVDNLRVIQQIKENVPEEIKQQIQQKEQQAVQKFKERFVDDPDAQSRADKFQELAKQMRENPDSATFAAIQQLEKTLPAEQRQFVQNMKNEASQGFVQRFQEEGDAAFKRIQSFDPSAIQNFQNALSGAGGTAQALLNRAVNEQIDFTQERIQNIDDPARFERIKMQFEQNPEIQQQIQARFSDFGSQFQNKEQEINVIKQQIESTFQGRIEQERQFRQEQGLPDFTEQELGNLKERALLRPQIQAEQQLQQQFKDQGGIRQEFEQRARQEFEQRGQQQFNQQNQGQPSQTGQEQRFDPRQFQPTERGELRSDEVRQEQRTEIRTESGRTEIRNEFEQRGDEERARQEIRTDAQLQNQQQQNFRQPSQPQQNVNQQRQPQSEQGTKQPNQSGQQQGTFNQPSSGGTTQSQQQNFRQPSQPQQQSQPSQGGTFQQQPQGGFGQPSSGSSGGTGNPPPPSGGTSGGGGSFAPPPSGGGSGPSQPPQ